MLLKDAAREKKREVRGVVTGKREREGGRYKEGKNKKGCMIQRALN